MNEAILYIYWIVFFIINLYILFSDVHKKKIPNKSLVYLIILVCFGLIAGEYFGLMLSSININIFATIIISFILFYFNIWSAGDAKYLIVLSLFLAPGAIIYTIGNIGFITIIFLFINMFYMYIIKSLYSKKYCFDLWNNIYCDIKDKLYIFLIDETNTITIKSTLKKILPIFVGFLILFTSIRLIRIYIVNAYINSKSNSGESRVGFILELLIEYNVYSIMIFVGLIYISYKGIKYFIHMTLPQICKKIGLSESNGKTLLLMIIGSLLTLFIYSEFVKNPTLIKESLIRIFTFYILIWLGIKLLLYIHYITFQLGEIVYKPIKKLNSGDIVDIEYLKKVFGTQKCLGYKQESGKYSPNPSDFFTNIEVPLTKKAVYEIKQIYRTVNSYHTKENTPGFEKIEAIMIIKNFAFAPYIFLGFILSFIYQDSLITGLVGIIMKVFLGYDLELG